MSIIRSVPVACGHYLPERVVENAEFAKTLDTSDEWITSRSGIKRRHFAAEGEKTSDLAIAAAKQALEIAGLNGSDIGAIVLATATPDQTFPSTAVRVQEAIGMTGGFAFDVQAVCAGFVFALSQADAIIRSGQAERVMVIGAETFSRILDFTDRSTCVLFGDGAGALILEAKEGTGENTDRGILSTDLHSDGRYTDILYVDGGPSSTGTAGVVHMSGREVFRHAVVKLAETGQAALDRAGLDKSDVTWLVPHQANLRIMTQTAIKLGIPKENVVVTVHDHGNTSAASIPLALSVAAQEGRFNEGDLLLMEAIGGGLAWGAATLRWQSAFAPLHKPLLLTRFPISTQVSKTAYNRGKPMSEKTLTRMELSEAVFGAVGLSRNESAELVESVLNHMSDALVKGESVKISSFGTFSVRSKSARVGRNPKTGEEVPIEPRRVLTFRPSHIMKERVDAGNKR